MTAVRRYAGVIKYWSRTKNPKRPGEVTMCILNLDGTMWCDWDAAQDYLEQPMSLEACAAAWAVVIKLALAAHGPVPEVPEVSRERAEEIALEYGAKMEARP